MEYVPWTYLIRIEFSFADKMKCIPSSESYEKVFPCGTVYYALKKTVSNYADKVLGVRTCNQFFPNRNFEKICQTCMLLSYVVFPLKSFQFIRNQL